MAELLPAFHARHPDIRVRVQQLPVDRGAREAADGLRRRRAARPLPARQHVAARAQRARRARAARCSRSRAPASRATTTSPASSTRTSCRRRAATASSACRGTSTRACSSIAATCCARPATRSRRRAGPSGATRCARSGRHGGGAQLRRSLLPLERVRAAAMRWHCSKAPLLADDDTRGAFSQAAVPRVRSTSTSSVFRDGLAPGDEQQRRSANVWDEFGRGLFAFYVSGPVEHRRVPAPPAAASDRTTGRPRRCRAPTGRASRPPAARASSMLQALAAQGRGVAAGRVPRASRRRRQRFHALTGDLPPRRSAWRTAALATDAPSQAFARPARARARRAEDPRMGAHLPGDAAHRRARGRAATQSDRRSDDAARRAGRRACSRSAAGCSRAPQAGDGRR